MILGLLFCTAALFLAMYNLWDDYRAGKDANQAYEMVAGEIGKEQENPVEETQEMSSEAVVESVEVNVPDFVLDPEMPMPEKEIDGQMYIGVLEMPTLELSLPIISEWNDARLKISPCRYVGSAYTRDLILSGHSYKKHFRYIRNLETGDPVIFTDMAGNRFVYEVLGMVVIADWDVDSMLAGDWDLSLFTCTYGGKSRNTIRCKLSETENEWLNY